MSLSVGLRSCALVGAARCIAWAAALLGGLAVAAEPAGVKHVDELGVDAVLTESERPADVSSDPSRREALAGRAATLLLAGELWERGEYATIRRLVVAAGPALAPLSEERQSQLENLLAGMTTEDGASFEQLQARVALLNAAEKHDQVAVGAIEKWLSSRDLSSLEVDEVAWCLAESLPDRSGVKEFSVIWTGTLTAPRSGKYEFSTTPINVNRAGADLVKHALVASVGDAEALNTPQEPVANESEGLQSRSLARRPTPQWMPTGATIPLTANQPIPIRVEMRFEAARPTDAAPAAAILCWKGPGLDRQAIAGQALAGPNGESGGLRAEYHWNSGAQEQTTVQDGAVVDVVWPTPASIASDSPQLIKQLSERLCSLAIGEEYLQRCVAGEVEHVYLRQPAIAGLLGSGRRQEFLELLVARPELLEKISDGQLLTLYRSFRLGAEAAAIDLLGTWMQQRADMEPEIVADFFEKNRRVYWELGQLLSQQPGALDRLRGDYLAMDDERCALSVAYTLSYGYRMLPSTPPASTEEKLSESPSRQWFELLTERLNDELITGNIRASWLIAKAQLMESRRWHLELGVPHEDYSAGKEWLVEAHLIADGNAMQSRIYAEEMARAAALNHSAEVKRLLKAAAGVVPVEESRAWEQAANAIAKRWSDRRSSDSRLTRAAYVRTLARRREQAASRGDEEAVANLDEVIEHYSVDIE